MDHTFTYEAQTAAGETWRGTIAASSAEAARQRLERRQLTLLALAPGDPLPVAPATPLPLAAGLRLAAGGISQRRLQRAVAAMARDVEAGLPLAESLGRCQAVLPARYRPLLDAAATSGSLPRVLLGLSRHLALQRRQFATLLLTLVIPAALLLTHGLCGSIMVAKATALFGRAIFFFRRPITFADTVLLLLSWMPTAVIVLAGILLAQAGCLLLAALGCGPAEPVVRRFTVIGPAAHQQHLAAWCHAVGLGLEAGMDLPAAVRFGGHAARSPSLRRDSAILADALAAGAWLEAPTRVRLLPKWIATLLAEAGSTGSRDVAMDRLRHLLQEKAQARLVAPAFLGPLALLLAVAGLLLLVAVIVL